MPESTKPADRPRSTFAAVWTSAFERDRSGYTVLAAKDPFENWDANRSPHATAERLLTTGADILLGSLSEPMGRVFVEKALLVADRALSEHKEESPQCRGAFPLNRAQLLRALVLSTGILRNVLDVDSARRASRDFAAWCSGYRGGTWDSQAEAYLLAAVRMVLLAGDANRVNALLRVKSRFKWHLEERAVLEGLGGEDPGATTNVALAERFAALFDRVRDPSFVPNVFVEIRIERLELGLLWQRYFASRGQPIDWARALEAVAE